MLQTCRPRGYLVDLDGTLVCDRKLLPGAKSLLSKLERFVLVSNDSEHTPSQLSGVLLRLGLSVPAERILLAGAFALELIAKERCACRVMLLGSPRLRRHGQRLGLDMTERRPDIVLVARDRKFNYHKLTSAVNAIRAGAELIATNPDLTHPGRGSYVVPETGALLAAILAGTGPIPHRIVGKPEPILFRSGLALLGLNPNEAVMIGDNPTTDGVGARNVGMGYLEVGSRGQLVSPDFP